MARIRSIKPGFFTNEDVAGLPFEWRLLFAGLWTQADRAGRLEDRPARLKAMLFPYDDLDVSDGLGSLERAGLIIRYEGNGLRLIAIPRWAKHQQPHIKEAQSEYPPPDTEKHGVSTGLARQEQIQEQIRIRSTSALRAAFDRFWAIYPRKVGKDGAWAKWRQLRPDEATVEGMIAAVEQQARTWNDPQFIPHPKTWLHNGRWKDEEPTVRTAEPDEPWHHQLCGHHPKCGSYQDCTRRQRESA